MCRRVGVVLCVVGVLWCISAAGFLCHASSSSGKQTKTTVGIVFFTSSDCPKCEGAKELVAALQNKYRLNVRLFDVERDEDYALFRQLEAIHGKEKFAVPLAMVGESILVGEDQIVQRLEAIVKKLSRTGGASLPYLGSRSDQAAGVKGQKQAAGDRDESVSRSSPGGFLSTIRRFFSWLF